MLLIKRLLKHLLKRSRNRMPFKSESQRKFLFSQKPEVAKEFAEHTSKKQMKDLPEKVRVKTAKPKKK